MNRFPTLIMRSPDHKFTLVCGHRGDFMIFDGDTVTTLEFEREELFDLGVKLVEHGLRMKPGKQYADSGQFWDFSNEEGF